MPDKPLRVADGAESPRAGPDLTQQVAKAVIEALNTEPQPVVAPGGEVPRRSRDPVLVALAIAGALLWQRTESIGDAVEQHGRDAAAVQAATLARVDALERANAADRAQARRHENTLRETLFILGEDSRAEWDALVQIHAAIRQPGTPEIKAPSTAERLTALREAMAIDRAP